MQVCYIELLSMRLRYKSSDALIHFFFLVSIAVLVGGFLFLLKEVQGVKNREGEPAKEVLISGKQTPYPTPQVVTKTVTDTKYIVSTPKAEKKVVYLNLNGNFSTHNTDWTDIKSTDTIVNLEDDYSKNAYVDWDAAVEVSSSGSKVIVRLYDVTHNLGVASSDLETSSTTPARVSSGRLYFWRGLNTYRVQIKSLNGAEATFEGGRIKIVY